MKCLALNGTWCELTVFRMYIKDMNVDLDVCTCV